MESMYNVIMHYGTDNMRWGERRYQNPDGSYTEEGLRRLREQRRKLETAKNITEAGGKIVQVGQKLEQDTRPKPPPKTRMDLSQMTDQEMRDRIQREMLERQYNELFNKQPPARISKGRQFAQNALTVGGAVLATTSTALGIAVMLKQLKEN